MPFLICEEAKLQNVNEKVELQIGEQLFVLGANGSGKSAFLQNTCTIQREKIVRISAFRQTWMQSNAINMTPANRMKLQRAVDNNSVQIESRWKDDFATNQTDMSLLDLVTAENDNNRLIAKAVKSEDTEQIKILKQTESPFDLLNSLYRMANIPITISQKRDAIVATHDNSPEQEYGINQLSDGERNALLLISVVVSAESKKLFVIDEPERHLHRSIISPLLTALFQTRKDCAFLIATHDINLAVDNPEAKTLCLRKCNWTGNNIQNWEADYIQKPSEITDEIKYNIYGSKKRVLFVEGTKSSLDKKIYSILFPQLSVIPQGNCEQVIRSVKGMLEVQENHWVEPYGIIDADNRTADEIQEFKSKNIYALPHYSVESLYFHPSIIEAIAKQSGELTGENIYEKFIEAEQKLIDCVVEQKQRLCAKLCERAISRKVSLPTWKDISHSPTFSAEINLSELLTEEEARFDELLNEDDKLFQLISRYPVRETALLSKIAKILNLENQFNYHLAAQTLLIKKEEIAEMLREHLGDITDALTASDTEPAT